MKDKKIKKMVKEGYARVAAQGISCCPTNSCCGSRNRAKDVSRAVGYSDAEIDTVPEGANLGLGCGNPVAIASLKEGDVVLDLGSGAGFDAFLASSRVGKTGRVIGVDMTPEMVEKARDNAGRGDYKNVEFMQGEIEKLPLEDASIDVIISNCVINLSPEKEQVFKEAFRVLKPGGRLMVSDLVLVKDLPDSIKGSVEAYVGCLAGAVKKDEYLKFIKLAGFKEVKVIDQISYPVDAIFKELEGVRDTVASIKVSAKKSLIWDTVAL
ncbi:MAG: arsenite methyltransferase [Candidatus Omnitrophota bacterium]